jgi:hypothetical protein
MGIMDDIRDMKDDLTDDTGSMEDRYEELRAQEAAGTITEEGRQELDRIREKLGR